MQKYLVLIVTLTLTLLAGCGGGGSVSVSGSSNSSGGSGGGSTVCTASSTVSGSTSGAGNVVAVTVDQGPAQYQKDCNAALNTLYATVTVCVPGHTDSSHCQTIDHVQVDTGSSGLRILSSVLTLGVGSSGGFQYLSSGNTGIGVMAECMQYVDGNAWGPIVSADLYIGGAGGAGKGEMAAGIPMQVIGTGSYSLPSGCTGTTENTVDSFGANGIIGIGSFQQDCGVCCTSGWSSAGCGGNAGLYYSCTSKTACAQTTADLAQQVSNPVSSFATDNNGVIISLPGVGSSGAARTLTGTLTFGIGTASNNVQPGAWTLLWLDPDLAEFTTLFNGKSFRSSYIDSGSNALYFPASGNSALVSCSSGTGSGFYCPSSTQSLSATLNTYPATGETGGASSYAVSFGVGNAGTLFNTYATYAVFSTLAASSSSVAADSSKSGDDVFDWGAPFFYGRDVYNAIQPGTDITASPYVAFVSNSSSVLNQ